MWVSGAKAMVPIRVCQVIDQAIQMHGAAGVSQWTPLADMYTSQRALRLIEGPDEVHWMVVGRKEVGDAELAGKSYDPKVQLLRKRFVTTAGCRTLPVAAELAGALAALTTLT